MKSIFLICLIGGVVSCGVNPIGIPNDVKNNFNLCYNNGFENCHFLQTKGFYVCKKLEYIKIYDSKSGLYSNNYNTKLDTVYRFLILFNDGIFYTDDGNYTSMKNIPFFHYLKQANKNGIQDKFYQYGSWGLYVIRDDTLIIQKIMRNMTWPAYEIKYKITSNETFTFITDRALWKQTESDRINYNGYLKERQKSPNTYQFVRFDSIPASHSWLKDEKWFWCNESEYEAWKKSKNSTK